MENILFVGCAIDLKLFSIAVAGIEIFSLLPYVEEFNRDFMILVYSEC